MWHDPSFYLALSFGLFLFIFSRPLYKKLKDSLDSYSQNIHAQMDNVNALYKEAQEAFAQKQEQLLLLENRITILEKEAEEKIFLIQQNKQKELEHLDTLFAQSLKQEKENMKDDFQKLIQKELIEKSYENVTWILENKLTKAQKEKITSSFLEKL